MWICQIGIDLIVKLCRYDTEGKGKDEDGSSEDTEQDEQEDKNTNEDEGLRQGGGFASADGINASSPGKRKKGKGKGKDKGKDKSKTASALIHHIPPEKKMNKNRGYKEEPSSGRATPVNSGAQSGSAEKEKVKGEPVVVRVRKPISTLSHICSLSIDANIGYCSIGKSGILKLFPILKILLIRVFYMILLIYSADF